MNEQNWRKERDSRSLRYAGRVLNPEDWITLRADQCYAERYDGQVAILTAANLLGRMSPAVALDIPSVPLVAPLSWVGPTLPEVLLDLLRRADPYGKFCRRSPRKNDYVIHLGRTSPTDLVVHGSGWNCYCGPSPSPLADDQTVNPVGPALAAIFAASEAFRTNLAAPPEKTLLNALNWQFAALEPDFAPLSLPQPTLGTLWTVGAGSVGTAILYFLSLATQDFSSGVFDMDTVKIHNLDRSPLFTADDVQKKKVVVTERYLNQAGIKTIQAEPHALDESELWRSRDQGTPDVLIAAANERNVREFIENDFPPVQIYGTTGRNWQATVIRHVPLHDPCSVCLFPATSHEPTACATGGVTVERENGKKQVDAALPFLSFAAGAMAAAEILKLGLPGYPFTPNRVTLNTYPAPRPVLAPLSIRENCLCRRRSTSVHRKMIEGTRFSSLRSHSGMGEPPRLRRSLQEPSGRLRM